MDVPVYMNPDKLMNVPIGFVCSFNSLSEKLKKLSALSITAEKSASDLWSG